MGWRLVNTHCGRAFKERDVESLTPPFQRAITIWRVALNGDFPIILPIALNGAGFEASRESLLIALGSLEFYWMDGNL